MDVLDHPCNESRAWCCRLWTQWNHWGWTSITECVRWSLALNIRDWEQGKNQQDKSWVGKKNKIRYYMISIAEKLEFLQGKRWKTPQQVCEFLADRSQEFGWNSAEILWLFGEYFSHVAHLCSEWQVWADLQPCSCISFLSWAHQLNLKKTPTKTNPTILPARYPRWLSESHGRERSFIQPWEQQTAQEIS